MAKVEGISKLIKQFEKFGEDVKLRADAELSDTADEIADIAKKNAPANLGKLKQGIQPLRGRNKLQWGVVAKEPYSGFVEFGTGIKVFVPAEMKDIANSIRNNKTDGPGTALDAIQDWCRQKGIDEQAAWPILMSILNEGLRPRPFLYPAWIQGGANGVYRLSKMLDKEVKKFNNAR